MNEGIDVIVSRYFSGEATKSELRKLDIWLSESNENEENFYQMTELYQLMGRAGELPDVDIEKAWTEFKAYMFNAFRNSELDLESAIKENIACQVCNDEMKKRNKGRIVNNVFKTTNLLKYAAAVALLAVASFAVYYYVNTSSTVQLMAVETQRECVLFENANVTLFENAEIVYDKKTNRQIRLTGKATFNIQSQNGEKLLVQAGETYIKDIGTVFTVDASAPDKSITVEVTEGEVWFYTDKNSGIYLVANQGAVYDTKIKQFRLIEKRVESPAVELIFNNTPLCEAIGMIKARYGVDIVVSSKPLNETLLNTSFDNTESVEYILEIITTTIDARLSKKGDVYVISKR